MARFLPLLWKKSNHFREDSPGIYSAWDSALAWLFAITYPQAPLFTENQNTKFLHGASDAGFGFLKEDWTATTTDPLPVFSLLIRLIYLFAPIQIVYGIFITLVALYAHKIYRVNAHNHPSNT